jgi:hypothetical protein
MAFRDVLALLLAAEADDAAIAAARRLAELNGRARAALLQIETEAPASPAAYVSDDIWRTLLASAGEAQRLEAGQLRARLARLRPPVPLEAYVVPRRAIRASAEAHARCADISVMVRPSADSGRFGAARHV